ncbi:MAG TPA: S8 family serine peptidase, partial [Candidatus Binataceae bacterium]|nr:S8 family serine peptidase [Candidatus Binataceae bacterium]
MRIGCLDTGVDGGHHALRQRIARFRYFGADGYSWRECAAMDSASHGTHVAGLIAGSAQDGLVLGIAPGSQLYCGAVIEEGAILARILLGLDWLAGCGLSVANLSLGITTASPVFRTMIRRLVGQDVLVVAPIGNRGAGGACAPGTYPEVLSVGAADESGRVVKFSGSLNNATTKACEKPDLVAPGVDLLSTVPSGGFGVRSGTSMSSGIVAGMAAVLRGAFPEVPAMAIANAMRQTSLALASDQPLRSRCGLVQLGKAFEYLRQKIETGISDPQPNEPCSKYVDPRLVSKLSCALDNSAQDAILEFTDNEARRDFEAALCRMQAARSGD